MKKSEIFNEILAKVCEVCEVSRACVINGSRAQNVVEARCLAVQYLRRAGLSSDDIAVIILRELAGDPLLCPPLKDIKTKAKTIDKTFNGYSLRCLNSKAFCLMSSEISQYIRDRYAELQRSGLHELPPLN